MLAKNNEKIPKKIKNIFLEINRKEFKIIFGYVFESFSEILRLSQIIFWLKKIANAAGRTELFASTERNKRIYKIKLTLTKSELYFF